MLTRIQTPKTEFTVDYPEACEFTNQQAAVFWPHFEVKVHKDKQDILVNMTPAERHGTITTLKLFTKYEQIIGDEFWLGFVYKKFPRPADIQPMAALFGAMETAVHGKFYSTLNEELGLATDEFYNEYLQDEDLKARVEFLESSIADKDDLRALGCFTFGEGAILYSSFAFLKHFQSQGKTSC
jgi:Ribonucleotide reductase, beta subunit